MVELSNENQARYAAVAEQEDARDLKSRDTNDIIPVRFRSAAPKQYINFILRYNARNTS